MPSKNTRNNMPSSDLKLVPENLRQFFYWMYERQEIWYNRFVLKKEQPWTKDKILQDYKFTNVYRELDRNSQWLIKNVIDVDGIKPFEVFWKVVVFRYFNLPELFDSMGGIPDYKKYNHEKFLNKVLKYKEKSGRVFTDAYMINPPKREEDRKLGLEGFYVKHITIFHNKAKEMYKRYKEMDDPNEFNKMLMELHCIAGFMAYEIYCDFCYTDWFKFSEDDFVNVGPGARFGLELLYPNLFVNRKNERYIKKLIELKDKADSFFRVFGFNDFKYYNKKNPKDYKNGKRLTLRCIEHSLCEYSKFWKQNLNVGKPRQKFVPKTKEL